MDEHIENGDGVAKEVTVKDYPKKKYSNDTHAYKQLIKELGIVGAPKYSSSNKEDVNMIKARKMYSDENRVYMKAVDEFINLYPHLHVEYLAECEVKKMAKAAGTPREGGRRRKRTKDAEGQSTLNISQDEASKLKYAAFVVETAEKMDADAKWWNEKKARLSEVLK
jgi:hypothetical protein